MPSGSSRTVERIEAGKADGDARMRQLIMELTRAQSAAALPAPAMPALTKAGGTHDDEDAKKKENVVKTQGEPVILKENVVKTQGHPVISKENIVKSQGHPVSLQHFLLLKINTYRVILRFSQYFLLLKNNTSRMTLWV